jgi:hypothetical protein
MPILECSSAIILLLASPRWSHCETAPVQPGGSCTAASQAAVHLPSAQNGRGATRLKAHPARRSAAPRTRPDAGVSVTTSQVRAVVRRSDQAGRKERLGDCAAGSRDWQRPRAAPIGTAVGSRDHSRGSGAGRRGELLGDRTRIADCLRRKAMREGLEPQPCGRGQREVSCSLDHHQLPHRWRRNCSRTLGPSTPPVPAAFVPPDSGLGLPSPAR